MSEVCGVGDGGMQIGHRKKGISLDIVEDGQRGEGHLSLGGN